MGMRELGAQLYEVRRMKGLSLVTVAEKADISPAYLQKLEKGQVKSPSPHIFRRLALALDLPYDQLMETAGYLLQGDDDHDGSTSNLLAVALKGETLTSDEAAQLAQYLAFLRQKSGTA